MTVEFRFYGPLNDFLPPPVRQATLVCAFESRASVKDAIEALGVPHPEVDRLVVNGQAVDFAYVVRDRDRVAVYPAFTAIDPGREGRLGPPPQTPPRFVADVHLGRLAAYLRLAGVDTTYRRDCADHDLVEISAAEDRTLLTRDVGLLKHGRVTRGYFVRHTDPPRQLVEVLIRFDLPAHAAPFTRCLACNGLLEPAPKTDIAERLLPRTREHYHEFSRCPGCGRVYWKGSHHARMRAFLDAALERAGTSPAAS